MNKKQKIVLCIAITVVVSMAIFPPIGPYPIQVLMSDSGKTWCEWRTQYYYGFLPEDYGHIRFNLLAIQYIIVAVITVGLIEIFRDKKPKDDQKQ